MARILVIDDDAEMRTMLEQTLQSAGHEIVLAEDGRQGLREHRRQPASVIITDIFMPEKDGIELLTALHQDSLPAPIIAISGNRMGGNMLLLAKGLGAAKIVEKPFQPQEILNAVEEVLRNRKA